MSEVTTYHDQRAAVWHGDCMTLLRGLADNSIDAIVTDPPYGLGFMGKKWDSLPPGVEWAAECLRVLKPGGHLLAFGGTRTWHRLAAAVEDAGFEIRDSIAWLYGSGFPKSLDVSKAIDKAADAEREVIRARTYELANDGGYSGGLNTNKPRSESAEITAPATDAAREWQGWGTALKPAFEPIVVARKPLAGTVAANVQAHGTGALNIDGCRIEHASAADLETSKAKNPGRSDSVTSGVYGADRPQQSVNESGRWPANVVLDEDQAAALDQQSSVDSGGASRFFYCAKAPKRERPKVNGTAHPTCKPLTLMRWLVRLVTPPGGCVLDPFTGSGTTVEAALLEGFRAIGAESEAEYIPLIEARMQRVDPTPTEQEDHHG